MNISFFQSFHIIYCKEALRGKVGPHEGGILPFILPCVVDVFVLAAVSVFRTVDS